MKWEEWEAKKAQQRKADEFRAGMYSNADPTPAENEWINRNYCNLLLCRTRELIPADGCNTAVYDYLRTLWCETHGLPIARDGFRLGMAEQV